LFVLFVVEGMTLFIKVLSFSFYLTVVNHKDTRHKIS